MRRGRFKAKAAPRDFTPEMLPATRFAEFWDRLRWDYGTIFFIGILLFAFCLPALGLHFYLDSSLANAYASLGESPSEEALQEYASWSQGVTNGAYLILIPCALIASLGFAGGARLIRLLVYDEPLFFWRDFGRGIRENCPMFLMSFGVMSLIDFLLHFLRGYLPSSYASLIYGIMLGLALLLLLPVLIYGCALTAVYSFSFGERIKTAALLSAKHYPGTLLAVLAVSCPLLTRLIPSLLAKSLILGIGGLFLISPCLLGVFLWCAHLFDLEINPRLFPDFLYRGLYQGYAAKKGKEKGRSDERMGE